jgi:hypothetical protein
MTYLEHRANLSHRAEHTLFIRAVPRCRATNSAGQRVGVVIVDRPHPTSKLVTVALLPNAGDSPGRRAHNRRRRLTPTPIGRPQGSLSSGSPDLAGDQRKPWSKGVRRSLTPLRAGCRWWQGPSRQDRRAPAIREAHPYAQLDCEPTTLFWLVCSPSRRRRVDPNGAPRGGPRSVMVLNCVVDLDGDYAC